jgi:adenylate cyclase
MAQRVVPADFERALSDEILASELIRMRVLAGTLAVLLVGVEILLFTYYDLAQSLAKQRISPWLPLKVLGPFLLYQCIAMVVITGRRRRGAGIVTPLRFLNAIVETSLPSVLLWRISRDWDPAVVFGAWPSLLYFIFIVASTLRLDFVLPAFTGLMSGIGYVVVVFLVLPLSTNPTDPMLAPIYHLTKAAIMVAAGIVAGLVAVRLRRKFERAVEEGAARERITNLFGQHVSPSVVERLLDRPEELAGETREICVMFLDIRNFTSAARERRPAEVVEFLNGTFAFMIEAVDRHGGFINKFLGDGFMAVFGAPLDDARAVEHAVAAARDILAEIGRRGLADGPWPLRVGIGLHAGPAVIGNVGSPRRKEFTAIGDTVNLASRLEQLNKEFASQLLVSETVMAALGPADAPATPLGDLPIKGYAAAIRVWRLA